MIHLTFFQSVIADFLNIAEIIIIYRFLTNSFTIKIMVVDFLVSLFITSIPTLIASLYILFVVIYLWLFDRIGAHTYIVLNNIFAMFVGVIMSSLFDLVDHYTYALFLQGKSNIFILGWLIPFNDLLVTIIFGIIVIKLIRPRLTWFIVNFPRPVRLWKITSIYFLLYIWLTVVAEKDGIANEYAQIGRAHV